MVNLTKAKDSHDILTNQINNILGGNYNNCNGSRNGSCNGGCGSSCVGGDFQPQDIKNKIINDINRIINPAPAYKHLTDIFNTPQLINRTNYFTDVVRKLDNLADGQKILLNN